MEMLTVVMFGVKTDLAAAIALLVGPACSRDAYYGWMDSCSHTFDYLLFSRSLTTYRAYQPFPLS